MTKTTKKDNFNAIISVLTAGGHDDLAAVIQNEIDLLDRKAAKAKERAATKKAETDALYDAVQAVLTGELATISEITDACGVEDATNAKVQARLKKLADAGVAVKEQVTIDKRKLVAYRLAD